MANRLEQIKGEITRLRAELEKVPGNPRLQARLGDLLAATGDNDGAVRHYSIALAINPTLLDTQMKCGNLLTRQCNVVGALACFSQVQIYQPQDWLRVKMALLLPPIVESEDHIKILRARIIRSFEAFATGPALHMQNPPRDGGSLFYLAYYDGCDRNLYEALAALYIRSFAGLTLSSPHAVDPDFSAKGRRIRVGFVSSLFFDHSIGRLNKGLIANLNRDKFEVTVLMAPHQRDNMTKEIADSADHAIELPFDLAKARGVIASQQFDILVYPEIGMDTFIYALPFARLAPVQCVSWGHPVTTGIPNMDYFVSAEALETPDSDDHYSETLIRLKELPPYYYKPQVPANPPDRTAINLDPDTHYYLIAQYLFKIHPGFDALIAGILERDPKGMVLMIHGTQRIWSLKIHARFKQAYPELADRLKFVEPRSREDFLSFVACMDVCLDIPQFSGGNTTFEALAVGTPVVALPGDFMRGRVCSAIYRKLGIRDLVATDADDYIDIAVKAASNEKFRRKVRSAIAKKSDNLFENDKAVREWEKFFLRALKEKGVAY